MEVGFSLVSHLQLAWYIKQDFFNHPIEALVDAVGAFECFREHLNKNEVTSHGGRSAA